ncbi:MAG TPA: MoxR family ATPase [Kofleriaceae bacterium]|nr:MoxR family ATPase [Kofleriaceae bacterium]
MEPSRATAEAADMDATTTVAEPPHHAGEPTMSRERDDRVAVEDIARAREAITTEIGKRVIGQRRVIEQLLVALFARGHCLFVGVPGLAKTLLISTLADTLNLHFSRIQFTPDLMPSDITGTEVLEEDHATGKRFFRFIHGPIFANLLLADEINRTPPKTQAALLQSMQEYQVTAAGQTFDLALPFMVLATQNPIEQEGTYPLPEAQLDRFMFQIDVNYPDEDEELEIVRQQTSDHQASLARVLSPQQILELQALVRRVPAADHVVKYAVSLARATRPSPSAPEFVRDNVSWGAGPRASQHLVLAAKARAILRGRYAVALDDIRALARPTLQHRIVLSYRAEAEGVTVAALIDRLLDTVS